MRIFHISWTGLLLIMLALFLYLRPMSVNYLNYLIWKNTSNPATQTGFIENRGAYIHYVAYGHGYPLLLLHGGLSNKLTWFSQVPWLVAAGRQVILIDTRGHGDSTHGNLELSYQLFAEDAKRVLDQLNIQRTDIVGWSDGGITALLLDLKAPERVNRIVAISANFHPSGLIPESSRTLTQDSHQTQNQIIDILRNWWPDTHNAHPNLENELYKLWQTSPQLKHADLQAIKAPTLIIAGENDVIDLQHSGELAQMLAFGKIEIILGAGHASLITHAKQINELIASFLGIDIN